MSTLNFRIDMLEWAANNIGLRLDQVVSKISGAEKTQKKLLAGEFSINQAEDFAELTKVPFGVLFLQEPPEKIYKPSIPDLRQQQNPEPLSDLFYEVLEDIQNKQEWYTDYLIESGFDQLDFVGKFKNYKDLDAETIANDIRSILDLPIEIKTKTNRENYLKLLIERCENVGILVFRNSLVKNATKKQLDTSEFRGFVLINPYAPAIFLNMQDMPSAIIFTLAHELAHIWIGESGVDDLDVYGNNPIEVLCNEIAAAVLVTRTEFLEAWNNFDGSLSEIADYFYVSKLMIARLALTFNILSKQEYQAIHSDEYEYFKRLPKKVGTPKFINMIPGRNSPKLTKVIVNQALSGGILLRDAGRLLNISPQNVMKLGGVN